MSGIEVKQILLARVVLPESHPEASGSDEIFGYLVRDGDECILFDTGVGSGSSVIDKLYQPDHVDLELAVRKAGASLDEITAVANSHLHFDHCGNNRRFPGIPIFVQSAELDAATKVHYTVPDWVDFPGAHYIPVNGRHKLSEHLELIPTPGHTPGHQSLMVHMCDHVEVVVAQAAYSAAEFQFFQGSSQDTHDERDTATLQRFIQSNATWSERSYLESLSTLHHLCPASAFFSHDSRVWKN